MELFFYNIKSVTRENNLDLKRINPLKEMLTKARRKYVEEARKRNLVRLNLKQN